MYSIYYTKGYARHTELKLIIPKKFFLQKISTPEMI